MRNTLRKTTHQNTFAPIVILAILLLIGALFAGHTDGSSKQPASAVAGEPTQDILSPQVNRKIFIPMVNTVPNNVYGVETASMTPSGGLDQIASAGTSWIRRPALWWPNIEPTQGVRNWNAPEVQMFDQEFKNAAQKNLKIIAVVRGTPSWAQKKPPYACGPIRSDKFAVFGNFMFDLVKRYSVPPYNVMYYQLTNEPDITPGDVGTDYNSLRGCWGDQNAANFGGEYYADMLKAVYPRIKQANPQAQVVLGGLLLECDPRIAVDPSHTGVGCHYNAQVSHANFLKGILVNGGLNYFDVVAFHSYDYYVPNSPTNTYDSPAWNSSAQTTGPSLLRKLDFIKGVLAAYGATGKYIMNTETALLCSCEIVDSHQRAKAFYTAQIYPFAIASGLQNTIWFRALDFSSATDKFNVGLLSDSLVPRYSYNAYTVSSNLVGSATYDRPLTTTDFGNVSDVTGNSFKARGHTLWTIWTTATSSRQITLPSMPSAAYDMYGKPITVDSTRKITLQSPDRLFIYVEY
jgi:hypothetical protein